MNRQTSKTGFFVSLFMAIAVIASVISLTACLSGEPEPEAIVGTWRVSGDTYGNLTLIAEEDGAVTGGLGTGEWERYEDMPTLEADGQEWSVYQLNMEDGSMADAMSYTGDFYCLANAGDVAYLTFENAREDASLEGIAESSEIPSDFAEYSFSRVNDE